MNIETLLSPADYRARRVAGFAGATCVVFDVLRATSVIVTGIANGAAGFIPVEEIEQALEQRDKNPSALLAGERDGLRITSTVTGGIEFDLGNSPREFTEDRVAGKLVITTTTNGTRALMACETADVVVVGSFLNVKAIASWIRERNPGKLVLVCAGTGDAVALEDMLCAGALCDLLSETIKPCVVEDSAEAARRTYLQAQHDLMAAVSRSKNGSRLLANSDLRRDVEFCLRRDVMDVVPVMAADKVIRAVSVD